MEPVEIFNTITLDNIKSATNGCKVCLFYFYDLYDTNTRLFLANPDNIIRLDEESKDIPFFTYYPNPFITSARIEGALQDLIIHSQFTRDGEVAINKLKKLAEYYNVDEFPTLLLVNVNDGLCVSSYHCSCEQLVDKIKEIKNKYPSNVETFPSGSHLLNRLYFSDEIPKEKKESIISIVGKFINNKEYNELYQEYYDNFFATHDISVGEFCEKNNLNKNDLYRLKNKTTRPSIDTILKFANAVELSESQIKQFVISYGYSPNLDVERNGIYLFRKYYDRYFKEHPDISLEEFCTSIELTKGNVSKIYDRNNKYGGAERLAKRSTLIRCAIGFCLSLEETNKLLEAYGHAPLMLASNENDAYVAAGLENKLSYEEIQVTISAATDGMGEL